MMLLWNLWVLMIVLDMKIWRAIWKFSTVILICEMMCFYARLKLIGEAYFWSNHISKFCRDWSLLSNNFHLEYDPHLLSEPEYEKKGIRIEYRSQIRIWDEIQNRLYKLKPLPSLKLEFPIWTKHRHVSLKRNRNWKKLRKDGDFI